MTACLLDCHLFAVDDRIALVDRGIVDAISTVNSVGAGSVIGINRVVCGATVELVSAFSADDRVIAEVSINGVVSSIADQRVVA